MAAWSGAVAVSGAAQVAVCVCDVWLRAVLRAKLGFVIIFPLIKQAQPRLLRF